MARLRQQKFRIDEASQVAEVRRAVADLARAQGLSDEEAGNAALALAAAGARLLEHARGGELIVRQMGGCERPGVEVIAIGDAPASGQPGAMGGGAPGPGMAEGPSAAFDEYTEPGKGSVLRMAFHAAGARAAAGAPQIGAICLPVRGETECGDAWACRGDAQGAAHTFLLADGLGHGPEAAKAAEAALATLAGSRTLLPADLTHQVHAALRGTRGAALGITQLRRAPAQGQGAGQGPEQGSEHGQEHGQGQGNGQAQEKAQGQALFAGVGNIAACIWRAEGGKQFASYPGIVGNNMRKVEQFAQPWEQDDLLIMHSDGMDTRWDLARHPGLAQRHAALIAAVLYRDHQRGRDDFTVLVVRQGEG